MRSSRRSNLRSLLPLFGLALAVGCGNTGGCAGGPVEPVPGGFQGVKEKNAAAVRISQAGFAFINANWKPLIANMMPTAKVSPFNSAWLDIPIAMPCTSVKQSDLNVVGLGDELFVCDNGKGGPKTDGYMDAKCDDQDAPCPVAITLRSLQFAPESPDKIGVTATISIDALRDLATGNTGSIYIDSLTWAGACVLPIWRMGCFVNFHSSRGDRPDDTVTVKMLFGSDEFWDGQLTFDLAPPNPDTPGELVGGLGDVESADFEIGKQDCEAPSCSAGENESMCGWLCEVANWGLVKSLIFDYVLKPQIQKMIGSTLDTQLCRPCNPTDPLIPLCPAASICQCPTGGTCEPATKVCMGDAKHGGRCVPRLLGFEGRIKAGEVLASYGGDPATKVDLLAAAGGSAPKVDSAFEAPMLGGVQAANQSACVPKLTAPLDQTLPAPTLESEGPADYHVGMAVSQDFLTRLVFEAHQSGALCLNLESATIPALSTGLLKIALPSLGVVSGSDTQDAPMMVVLRPLGTPVLQIGEGTYNPSTKKPIAPLLTIGLTDLRIDLYALVEDRFVRLFTIAADVKVPLSLIVEGCPMTVLPALGDLGQMIVIRKDVPNNAELLAEDPSALTELIPVILGMAEPVLASSLKPIVFPDMNGFRIKVNQLKGVTRIGATDDFYYLGVYGQLGLSGQCESWGPTAHARLASTTLPPREEMVLRAGHKLPWPKAVLDVWADDLPDKGREMEFAWRVDGGLWSTWLPGPQLEVQHPALVGQARHRIEVRARIAGEAALVGPPSEGVVFAVDWEPPRVKLDPNPISGLLDVAAADSVSPAETLEFAYRVGDGTLSAFGSARQVDLAAVEAAGSVEVRVKDEAGLVGTATWKAPRPDAIAQPKSGGGAGEPQLPPGGCSSAGAGLATGLWALALAGLPLALRRRRQKNA
ncbi:MAG TPA: hypothetical protein VGK67_21735 [Myxococcales bacterium]